METTRLNQIKRFFITFLLLLLLLLLFLFLTILLSFSHGIENF